MKRIAIAALATVGTVLSFGTLVAQQPDAPAIKRSVLLKKDASVEGREFVMVNVEIPPGASEGKHTHPADVFAFVLEGTPTFEVEGQEARVLKPGDVFNVPQGQVHVASNKSSSPVRIAAVFFAEKGKPLTTPVQK